MPVKRIDPAQHHPAFHPLLEEFEGELRMPASENAYTDQPRILEDPQEGGRFFAVTALWEKWKELPLHERSQLILDAYKAVKGEQEMLKISRALGLTQEEAQKVGLVGWFERLMQGGQS